MTYADDDTAEEWGDSQNYSATAVGLVSRVAGSDDAWSSDEEPEEVRTSDVRFRARSRFATRRRYRRAVRDAHEGAGDARGLETFTRTSDATTISRLSKPSSENTRKHTS